MNLTFKKIIIHGFLSYGHSEILLDNMGYCLVNGINKCPLDNATSNGAGKSSWINALCWVLTGVTVQGNRSNLKNIFLEDPACYVTLFFDADGKSYEITRTHSPKSDLKIHIDGEDKSGKGIEESRKILASYLPDLTKETLTTTVILGQGLPDRFTNNTPAGRKEVLEKLSKSDFMIEDLKARLVERSSQLAKDLRVVEDSILAERSKRPILEGQLTQQKQNLIDQSTPRDFDAQIKDLQQQIEQQQQNLRTLETQIKEGETQSSSLTTTFNELYQKRQQAQEKVSREHREEARRLVEGLATKRAEQSQLERELKRLSQITDICPTCGQKLPNVTKPDLSPKTKELEIVKQELQELTNAQQEDEAAYQQVLKDIDSKFTDLIKSTEAQLAAQKEQIKNLRNQYATDTTIVNKLVIQRSSLEQEKTTHEATIKNLQNQIQGLEASIKASREKEDQTETQRVSLKNHQEVINKMTNLIRKDFRGYLLQNIIAFMDSRCKDYAEEVFGTRELEFKLNGNNIDILYAHKDLESLSGGEQQRVNIIIQLALRDMMCRFLNFSSNLIILDELFDQLDPKSTHKVVDLINHQLKDLDSVFIISHHAQELELGEDSHLTVVKDERGVSSVIIG